MQFTTPGTLSFRTTRNVLVLSGLLFFFGLIGSPLTFIWGRLVVEGRVFNGVLGAAILRGLDLIPKCVVAFFLGAFLPSFIDSPRKRAWALGFAAYLGFFHLMTFRLTTPETSDTIISLGAALVLAAAGFLGYATSATREGGPRRPPESGA